MYELTVQGGFAAAHRLREYGGACENLHGHNWRVEVHLAGEQLDEIGILVDFREVKRLLAAALDELDHKYLNEVPPFDRINPTTENLSRHLCERLRQRMPERVRIRKVVLWESDGCGGAYLPEADGS
jgi:6-pyruvoyltetrahydropterin/6-carboxytetrahydropterin synthase